MCIMCQRLGPKPSIRSGDYARIQEGINFIIIYKHHTQLPIFVNRNIIIMIMFLIDYNGVFSKIGGGLRI